MGTCCSKPKQEENEVRLLPLKPIPSSAILLHSRNNNQTKPCQVEKSLIIHYEETVETLLGYLCTLFNRRCPHCKNQIKTCARTEAQIHGIFTMLKEKVAKSCCASLIEPPPLKPPQFATIRGLLHENRFLSFPLQQHLLELDKRPLPYDNDYNVPTEVIFRSNEVLYDDEDTEYDSVIETCPSEEYYYDYGYKSAANNLTFILIQETDVPLCLSVINKKGMWG